MNEKLANLAPFSFSTYNEEKKEIDSMKKTLPNQAANTMLSNTFEIFHVKGPVGPVVISTSNFWGIAASGASAGIKMTETGDKIKCIYENGSWFLWEATAAGASGPSIIYSRNM